MSNVIVLVAARNNCWKPSDDCYKIIEVGACLNHNHLEAAYRDDVKDNISKKNPFYCELTGLYWAWKNTESDVLGLCHYRRFFQNKMAFAIKKRKERILSLIQIEHLMEQYDVIIAAPREYYIESVYSHYVHAHNENDLIVTRKVLSRKYPEYLASWDSVMESTSFSLYNMFIMNRLYSDNYCKWLFDVLFSVENELNISTYNKSDARVFGYLGEFLLNVWIKKNGLNVYFAPVQMLQKQNWVKKIWLFLWRKIRKG